MWLQKYKRERERGSLSRRGGEEGRRQVCRQVGVEESQIMHGSEWHKKEFGFYLNCDGKSLRGFEQEVT